MSKRARQIIAIAALLASGRALLPAAVADTIDSFRPCGSDEVLYDASTDDIAVYYGPAAKYIVFPSIGQLRYLGRSRSPDYTSAMWLDTLDPRWRLEATTKVKELRATGRCKATAGG
jgi:hypothetical protein